MRKKFKKILITGSSGTIGTALFEKLLKQGYKVIGFDKKPNEWHLYLNKLTIIGNLLSKKDIRKLPTNFDLIIHLAANARVYNLVLNPSLALENIVTTYNILEFARVNNIKAFIFSSSREVYGNSGKAVSSEKEVDIRLSESPYMASKISGESLTYAYSKCFGIDYIILRLSNVYGRYDANDRFIPLLIRQMKKNQPVFIYGKDKILDFTYIDDCVDGIIKSIECFPKVKNDTFNIASGKGYFLLEVAHMLKEFLKSEGKILIRKSQIGEVTRYVADISKAKILLRYKPRHSLRAGIISTISWYNNYYQNTDLRKQ